MRVLVLGCGGFVGSHLVEVLLDSTGHEVVGLDRSPAKVAHLVGRERFEFVAAELPEVRSLPALVARSDVVIHLAAICNPSLYNTKPIEVIEANFLHAFPVVRLCAEEGKRLVYFSTSEVYGKTLAAFAGGDRARAEDPSRYVLAEDVSPLILGPVSAQRWTYACAKQLMERTVYAYGKERGLHFTIVRPFNFLGPRMDYLSGIDGEGVPRVFACFMKALLSGEPLALVEGGRSRRTFVCVREAAGCCARIVERPEASRAQIFNIGNPANETSIADLAALMRELFEEKTSRRAPPAIEVSALSFYGEGYEDSDRRVPDVSRAERLLGWRPEVSLRELVSRTMDWYIETYGARSAVSRRAHWSG